MPDLYYYGYILRPPMPGAQPSDDLNSTWDADNLIVKGLHLWGYAVYTRRLSKEEMQHYSLIELSPFDIVKGDFR